MHEPTSEDMAALRQEGTLVDFLLSTTGRSRKKPRQQPDTDPDEAAAARPITSPLHKPGRWPFGLGPPGPNTCHPDCDCAIKPRSPEGSTP
jgi:hypothetical protein